MEPLPQDGTIRYFSNSKFIPPPEAGQNSKLITVSADEDAPEFVQLPGEA
jgi:hypothetical protein